MQDRPTRFHALDHLRATMISIVMFGHALLPYTTIPRSFKDPETHIGFDVAAIFLYSFAMPLFFVTAGFSTALIFELKGERGLWQNRVRRILIPLVIAYFLLTPLTRVAYKFAKNAASSGSLQAGIDAVQFVDWIHWGKAYHLWFLVSLLLYSVMAIWLRRGLLRISGDRLRPAVTTLRRLLASRWHATALSLVAATIMVPAYVFYGSDATTLPMQLVLFGFFLLGWLLYLHRDLLPTLQFKAWQSVAVALAVSPLAVWSTREQLMRPDDVHHAIAITAGVSNSVLAAFMTFGLLGIYQTRFNAASAFGRYISDASYWIFLIHFPLLIAVAGVVSVLPYSALIKYLLTLAVVVPIVFSTYRFVVRRLT